MTSQSSRSFSSESNSFLNRLFRTIGFTLKLIDGLKSTFFKKLAMKFFWFVYMLAGLFLFPLFRMRLLEYSWVCKNLGSRHMRILDVGCSGSLLPLYVASDGHHVYGIDLRDCFVSQFLGFNSAKGDMRRTPFRDGFFDRIIAVSSIEHVGSGWDRSFIPEMYRVLKDDGRVILTFPYGKESGQVGGSRVYDDDKIGSMLGGEFKMEKDGYMIRDGWRWVYASREQAKEICFSIREARRRRDINSNVLLILSKNNEESRVRKGWGFEK